MDPDVARLAQVLSIVGMFAASMIALALVTRVLFRWGSPKRVPREPAVAAIDDTRFSRLEDAVDAIAIEVERIAEAQRFSAKLLSERASEKPLMERSGDR